MKILLVIISYLLATAVGGLIGSLMEQCQNQRQPEIITSEIHLKIPKDDAGLKKQWLHISCQKTMLEEMIKWDEKTKKGKEKK